MRFVKNKWTHFLVIIILSALFLMLQFVKMIKAIPRAQVEILSVTMMC